MHTLAHTQQSQPNRTAHSYENGFVADNIAYIIFALFVNICSRLSVRSVASFPLSAIAPNSIFMLFLKFKFKKRYQMILKNELIEHML